MTFDDPLIISSEERDIDAATAAMLRRTFMPDSLTPAHPPTLYATAGIPGAGKSIYVDRALETGAFPKNAVVIDPDRVMQLIPDYVHDLADRGAEKAYQRFTLPARAFAYELFEAAGEKRFNIVQDMGSSRQEMYDRLQRFKAAGYILRMIYIHCSVPEALRRLRARARFTPKETVLERDQSLRKLLPLYQTLADEFIVLDNMDFSSPFKRSSLAQLGIT